MKKLFTAIRKEDFESVKDIIEKKPETVNCVSTGAPKKDFGQSPLQVALKSSSTEIIHYLLDKGADVNFIEKENSVNPWRAPVIHDAINRAVMCSRWNIVRDEGIEVFNNKEKADEAFEILKRIIELGADVNQKDSYSNACLDRACLQACQILPRKAYNDRLLTNELKSDIERIFNLLIESGADLNYINSITARTMTYAEEYMDETLGMFLR